MHKNVILFVTTDVEKTLSPHQRINIQNSPMLWSTLILLSVVSFSSRITEESWLTCEVVYFLSGITFCFSRGGLASRIYANKRQGMLIFKKWIYNKSMPSAMCVYLHVIYGRRGFPHAWYGCQNCFGVFTPTALALVG